MTEDSNWEKKIDKVFDALQFVAFRITLLLVFVYFTAYMANYVWEKFKVLIW